MSTILVTGDSRGLGAEVVEALLTKTDHNVVGMSRSKSEFTEAFDDEFSERYAHVQFDLSNPDEIPSLYEQKLKPQGPIYGVVNNAAKGYDDLVSNTTYDDLIELFNINVISPILLSKYALRDMMLNRTKGSLVHLSSVSTSTGYKGLSMYGATKGALEAFSLGLAREWGERGIRSNCIAPGFMDTAMTDSIDESQKSRIYARTALGEPTDQESVAELVVFLLSDAAASITGETIRVDAGTL